MPDSPTHRPGLPAATLVFGDEPLLVEEAADDVRRAAHRTGFDERVVLTVEPGFDWGRLDEAAQSLSLFSTRRLIDLRLPTGKPGEQGAGALCRYCDRPSADNALLVVCGRLDARTRKAKWFKAIAKTGRTVEKRPVPPARLGSWILDRARRRGIGLDTEAAALLSHYTEGNLLAAAQEIDKLGLLAPEGARIGLEDVSASITDSARFTVYTLVDHCLAGDAVRAMRSLNGLSREGVEPIIVNWALAGQIRTLYRLCCAIEAGRPRAQLFSAFGIWQRQAPLIDGALSRHGRQGWARLLQQAAAVDRVLKGREPGSAWSGIERLCLSMCGEGYARVAT